MTEVLPFSSENQSYKCKLDLLGSDTHENMLSVFVRHLPHMTPSMMEKMKACFDLICVIQFVFSPFPMLQQSPKSPPTRRTQEPEAHVCNASI